VTTAAWGTSYPRLRYLEDSRIHGAECDSIELEGEKKSGADAEVYTGDMANAISKL